LPPTKVRWSSENSIQWDMSFAVCEKSDLNGGQAIEERIVCRENGVGGKRSLERSLNIRFEQRRIYL